MKSFLFLFSTALFLSTLISFPLHAEEDLYVEGIVYESHVPEESLAVVNGVLLNVGDKIRDYTVKEIKKTSVVFTDAQGQEKTVSLLAEKLKRPTSEKPRLPETATEKEAEKSAPQPPASEAPFEVTNILNKVKNMTLLVDLKNIQMKSLLYLSEQNQIPTIKELVEKGMLNPVLANGTKGNYEFSIGSGGRDGVVVYADPINNPEAQAHYMLDEWSNLHVEMGKKATAKSEIQEMGHS